MDHLERDYFNAIAQHLDENVYGANGIKTRDDILCDLIREIRNETDIWSKDLPLLAGLAEEVVVEQLLADLGRLLRHHDPVLPEKLEDATVQPPGRLVA